MSIITSATAFFPPLISASENGARAHGGAENGSDKVFNLNAEVNNENKKKVALHAPWMGLIPSQDVVFETQSAQEFSVSAIDEEESAGADATRQAFLDYIKKTPLERYFETFLKSKGMSQEAYEALPPEEKEALLEEFRELMKRQMLAESGVSGQAGGSAQPIASLSDATRDTL